MGRFRTRFLCVSFAGVRLLPKLLVRTLGVRTMLALTCGVDARIRPEIRLLFDVRHTHAHAHTHNDVSGRLAA